MSEDNSLERDIGKLSYLLNQIKEPIVCVKCSDEFMTGQTDAKSLQPKRTFTTRRNSFR